ncbi:MAG: hypothetical protein RL011_1078 [Pseudomonadota bacterium]|jgi:hypothetical protein
MSRILDFTFSPEEAVVSRVLILVHRAVDEHLPYAQEASRQFTKTVYSSDNDSNGVAALGSDEVPPPPSPAASVIPPPPPIRSKLTQTLEPETRSGQDVPPPPPPPAAKPKAEPSASKKSSKPQQISRSKPRPTKAAGHENDSLDSIVEKSDWVSRVTAVFLIVGIAVLLYVLVV